VVVRHARRQHLPQGLVRLGAHARQLAQQLTPRHDPRRAGAAVLCRSSAVAVGGSRSGGGVGGRGSLRDGQVLCEVLGCDFTLGLAPTKDEDRVARLCHIVYVCVCVEGRGGV
jgi:hypothetical protein